MNKIIKKDRSIIPACDVPLGLYEKIVKETADIEGIGGYKVGFFLGLEHGLPKIVEITRRHTDKPVIYDHQKAGTDIPETGGKFARVCKDAGVNAIILFPQAGPETERAWIQASRDEGLGVIVGGLMTHAGYRRSEGGFLADEAVMDIYLNAAGLGVRDFVVPGNRPDEIKRIKKGLEGKGVSPIFYAPGFIAQGGKIDEAVKAFGSCWHAIVGRAIYEADDIKKRALYYTSMLND